MKEFKAKVIVKFMKGIIWKRPCLGVEFTENLLETTHYDLPVSMAFWHSIEKGSIILISMEQHEDGLWYPIQN